MAPVKAPLAWPKSSLARSSSDSVGQLVTTKGFAARAALPVDGAGQDALAGPVLAGDQHRRVGGGDARRGVEHRVHGGRAAGDLDVRDLLGQAPLELGDLGGQVPLGPELLDQVANLRGRERLGQVVPGAPAHRLDRRLDGAVGGDEDDPQVGLLAEELGEQVEAALGPQRQVDEGQVVGLAAQRRQRGFAGADRQRLGAQPLEADGQRGTDVLFVVDDQDAHPAGDGGRVGFLHAGGANPTSFRRRWWTWGGTGVGRTAGRAPGSARGR